MNCVRTGSLALVLAGVLMNAPAFAQEDGVAGVWELTMETPQGANTVNLVLKQEADKVSGELNTPLGLVPVSGTQTGAVVALTARVDVQGTALLLDFKGTVAGDTLNGNVKAGDFGEFPFKGKRAAGAAASPAPALNAAGAQTDAGGRWDVVIAIPGVGALPLTATLQQDGTKVTGTLNSIAGTVNITGTMTGTSLRLEFVAETPQGQIPISMTGELGVTGFAGKASVAGMGEVDWKGTRGK